MADVDPFAGRMSRASTADPFASRAAGIDNADPFAGRRRGGLAKAASNVGDALDYQRSKSQEAIFHKGSNDANRAALRKAIGVSSEYDDPRLFGTGPGSFGIPVPAWATHLGRGLTDTALDTAVDPLTYEPLGAIAKLAKGGVGLAARAGGSVLKGLESAPLVGDAAAAVNKGANAFGQEATNLSNQIHDYFTHAGKATRELGKDAVDHALGAAAKTASHETELDRRLQARFDSIRSGLSDADFATALQIQKGERQATTNEGRLIVSPEAAAGAAALRHLFKQTYALRADESGQRRIAQQLVGERPATAKTVVASVKPKVNEVEATRDIEANNIARGRIVDAFAKDALPTIEQHPDYIAGLQHLRDYRVGGKGFTEEQIAANAARLRESIAHRIGGDRFRALSPDEQEAAIVNAGGTRRVMSTGGNRYVTNAGSAFGKPGAVADPIDKEIKPLVDAQRPIIDKSKRGFKVTARAATAPYELDADLAEFAGQPGSLSSKQFKSKYVPGPRDPKAVDPNRPADTYNRLDKFDPNAEHQGEFTIDPANPAAYEASIRAALSNTATQVGKSELRKELTAKFGGKLPAEISKLFDVTTKATGTARSQAQRAADFVQPFIELPKRAVVGVLPRHMINVASLAATNNPIATAKAIAQVPRIMKGGAERYEALRPGIEAGAIGPRAAHDLEAPQWLTQLGLDKFAPVRALGDAGNRWGRMIDNATWSMDEAAANELAKARGGTYSAGRAARKALVDYDNASPFTKHARRVAPFATFETGIPGAVAKAIARDPRRVEAANRATGGTLLGGETDVGGHTVRLNLPTAKVGRLLGSGDVPEYVRGALADPYRAAISLATGLSAADKRHYMTYGLDPYKPGDLRKIIENMALGGVPEARDVLNQIGEGPFKPKPAQNFLDSLLNFGGSIGQGATGVRVR